MVEGPGGSRTPVKARRSGLRAGRGDRRRCRFGRLRRAVDQLLQLLSGLEVRDSLRRDVHLVPGLGIATLAGPALPDAEAPEAAQFDLLVLAQGLDDRVEDRVHDDFGVLFCQLRDPRNLFHQLGLSHGRACPQPLAARAPEARHHAPRPLVLVLALFEAVATPSALFLAATTGVTGDLAEVDRAAALRLHIVLQLLAALVLH